MRGTIVRGALRAGAGALIALLFVAGPGWAHVDVPLVGYDGSRIDPATSTAPYSPKRTCGACHDYVKITSGYHFQQGFDKISDEYSASKPWILSPGMVGKW